MWCKSLHRYAIGVRVGEDRGERTFLRKTRSPLGRGSGIRQNSELGFLAKSTTHKCA